MGNIDITKIDYIKKPKYYPEIRKRYYEKVKNTPEFKQKSREQNNNWRKNNPEKAKAKDKRNRDKNREKRLAKRRQQYAILKQNDNFKIKEKIRTLIRNSFKRGKLNFDKIAETENILGCSIQFFIEHLLSKVPVGVTLNDFCKFGYHIDHIIPIKTAKTHEDLIKLNHYTNLQPLWWEDNLKKAAKI